MSRDVNDIVVLGFGAWSDVNALPTLGFGSSTVTTIGGPYSVREKQIYQAGAAAAQVGIPGQAAAEVTT